MSINKIMLAALVLMAGCASQAEPGRHDVMSHRDPVQPERESQSPSYHSVLSGYHSRQVVEPEPWTVAPGGEKQSEGAAQ